jgi:hypothetical protein
MRFGIEQGCDSLQLGVFIWRVYFPGFGCGSRDAAFGENKPRPLPLPLPTVT